MTAYGLPKPDHKLLEAHPTVSAELSPRIGARRRRGQAQHRSLQPAATVRFADGSEEEIDPSSTAPATRSRSRSSARTLLDEDNRLRSTTGSSVEHPGLYFIGFMQPLGPIMPIAEAQSEWVADCSRAGASLPDQRGDAEEIAAEDERCGSATSPLSVTRSRSTSIPICASSAASGSGLAQPACRVRGRGPHRPGRRFLRSLTFLCGPAPCGAAVRSAGALRANGHGLQRWKPSSVPRRRSVSGLSGSPTRRARARRRPESSGRPPGRRPARSPSTRAQCRRRGGSGLCRLRPGEQRFRVGLLEP